MSKLYTGLTAVAVLLLTCSVAAGAVVEFKDPLSDDQYYLDMMHFPEAWARIKSLNRVGNITVAVADTGFEGKHLDLDRSQLVRGINIVNGKRFDLAPQHPHGMGTIGPIGALSGNDAGISRAAWQAKVMPIKVSTRSDGAAYLGHLAEAIRYAADHGARVISVSYGGVNTQTLENAARYAHQRGAVVFMSAGNDGQRRDAWPNHKFLMAVGSVGDDSKLSSFSTRGTFLDFVAPGEHIVSLTTNDKFTSWSGTSFSSPIAASVAALMLIANPDLSPWQVRSLMSQATIDLGKPGYDPQFGWGMPDAEAAVELALATPGTWGRRNKLLGNASIKNDLDEYQFKSSSNKLIGELKSVQGFIDGYAVIPEPGTIVLMLAGLGLMTRCRRRLTGN